MQGKAPTLTATKRERLGSKYTDRVRKQGGLPAVVYGHKEPTISVSLNAREALAHFHKGEKVFNLQLEGDGAPQTVLLKDLQFDHLGSNIIHCDLARVSLTDRVTVKVPVHLIGDAKGLKTAGAILMHPTNELDVECRVTDIPDFVEVEITELDVGHAITAREAKLPADMKLKTDPHAILAQIVIQQELKVEEEAVVDAAAAAEPEVITAKKKEGEEGAEGEAAKPGAKAAAPAKGAAPAAAPAKGAAPAAAKPAAGGEKKK